MISFYSQRGPCFSVRAFICLLCTLLLTFGCWDLSDAERQAKKHQPDLDIGESRKVYALDISGSYATDSGSEVDMEFDIQNEDGPNDILITLKRHSRFTGREIEMVKNSGEDLDDFKKKFQQFELYSRPGSWLPWNKPENFSPDFGETGQFKVCSEVDKLRYCIDGEAQKASSVIAGTLELVWYNKKENSRQYVVLAYTASPKE